MGLGEAGIPRSKIRCAVLYSVFVIYTQYIQYVGISIPHMVTILGALLVMYYVAQCMYNGKIESTSREHSILLCFFVVTFATGMIGAVSFSAHLSVWVMAFNYFLVTSCTMYIMDDEYSIATFVKLYGVFTIVIAVTLIVHPVATTDTTRLDSIRYSISAGLNANILGMILALGCWCILLLYSIRPEYGILAIIGVPVLVSASILTASRKSLISILMIVGIWLVWIVLPEKGNGVLRKLILICLIVVGVWYLYKNYYLDSTMSIRMEDMFNGNDESNQVRKKLYSRAFDLFSQNPLVGWGYGGYGIYYSNNSNSYSHATYAELPACTGIVGCVIFGGLYVYSIIKVCYLLVITRSIADLKRVRVILKMILILWLFILFTSAVVIYFYELNCFITWGILFSTIKYAENCINEFGLFGRG